MRKTLFFLLLLVMSELFIGCPAPKKRAVLDKDAELIDVRVYYVRHGLSCGNIAPVYAEFTLQDPSLSQTGLENSQRAGLNFQYYLQREGISLDFVGSSSLMRAKQTAMKMFPAQIAAQQGVLYEIADMGECLRLIPEAWQKSNTPHELAVQQLKLAEQTSWQGVQLNDKYGGGALRNEVDYEHFLTNTLPSIVGDLQKKQGKKQYHIAIVTHSLTMKYQLGCVRNPGDFFTEKPTNNEVYFIDYKYQLHQGLELVSEGSCQRAMEVDDSTPGPQDQNSCQ